MSIFKKKINCKKCLNCTGISCMIYYQTNFKILNNGDFCSHFKKKPKCIKQIFKVGDIIEYVGPRKELTNHFYEVTEVWNTMYVLDNGLQHIPFELQHFYKIAELAHILLYHIQQNLLISVIGKGERYVDGYNDCARDVLNLIKHYGKLS